MAKIVFLKTSPIYKWYLDEVYRTNPFLCEATYQDQYKAIMDGCFGWADFWKKNLELAGPFEVTEIVTGAEILQKTWAKEHDVPYQADAWQLQILEEQIRIYEPTVWFAHDFSVIQSEFRLRMKKKYPFLKLIIGWDGIAIQDKDVFAGCDIILSCLPFVVEHYVSVGINAKFLPFGFETSLLNKIQKKSSHIDFSFIGSLILKEGFHSERLRLLAYLLRHTTLQVWLASLPERGPFIKNQLGRFLRNQAHMTLSDISDTLSMIRANRGVLFGLPMYETLANSRLTLNVHTDRVGQTAGNMRLMEATGVGACLLTDWKENIVEYFEPEKEIVTFRSIDEAREKVGYLLTHPDERNKIAQAGQRRTLDQYSFKKRIETFSHYVCQYL